MFVLSCVAGSILAERKGNTWVNLAIPKHLQSMASLLSGYCHCPGTLTPVLAELSAFPHDPAVYAFVITLSWADRSWLWITFTMLINQYNQTVPQATNSNKCQACPTKSKHGVIEANPHNQHNTNKQCNGRKRDKGGGLVQSNWYRETPKQHHITSRKLSMFQNVAKLDWKSVHIRTQNLMNNVASKIRPVDVDMNTCRSCKYTMQRITSFKYKQLTWAFQRLRNNVCLWNLTSHLRRTNKYVRPVKSNIYIYVFIYQSKPN